MVSSPRRLGSDYPAVRPVRPGAGGGHAAGSGNTAACYGIQSNTVKLGYAADLIICDAPLGSAYHSATESLKAGVVPGISTVFTDGEVLVSGTGVNAAPPKRAAQKL